MMQGGANAKTPALILAGEAATNVGLSITLGLSMGIEGVALATLLASAAFRLGLLIPAACRTFGISLISLLAAVVRAHSAPTAAGLAIGWAIKRSDLPSALLVILGGGAMFTAYLVIFAFTGLEQPERARVRAAIRAARRTIWRAARP
jgi:peptidoglycan biosynthesis protein MviN/MurJ (putative lipid II flippase)